MHCTLHYDDRRKGPHTMLQQIAVDTAVRHLRPDFAVLAMTAEGLANGLPDAASAAWLRAAAERAANPAEDPHVEAGQEAYRGFGAKPKRTRPSVDALLRRAGSLPEINRVVDAYNAVSVEYVLPV